MEEIPDTSDRYRFIIWDKYLNIDEIIDDQKKQGWKLARKLDKNNYEYVLLFEKIEE